VMATFGNRNAVIYYSLLVIWAPESRRPFVDLR
jgi:hypothetical protein